MKANIITPVVTALDHSGKPDYEANKKIIDFLIQNQVDGILVLTENGDYVRARVTDTQLTLTPLSAAKLSPGGELPVAQAPDIEHGCVLHDCRPQRVGGWNICPPNFFVPALSFRSPCFVCPPGSRPDASTNNFLLPW